MYTLTGLEIKKKFGRNFENFSREINWGHLIKK